MSFSHSAMFSIGLKRHSLLLLDSVPCTTVIPDVSLIWISMISLGGDMWSVMWFSNVTTTTHEQALRQRAEEDVPGFKEVMERYARVSNTRIGRPLYLPNVVICHNCDLRCHALLCLAYNRLQHLTTSYNHYKSQWYGPKAMEMFKLSKRLREMSLQWSMISLRSLHSLDRLIHAIPMPVSKRGCCSSWPSSWENPNISSTSHLAQSIILLDGSWPHGTRYLYHSYHYTSITSIL